MAGFYDTTIGQRSELDRVLAAAGFDNKLVRRIIKNPSLAAKMLGAISEPRIGDYPDWYCGPALQLLRAQWLWPTCTLPKPPACFVPGSKTSVLLLHVPQPIDELWDAVDAPLGYTKLRWHTLRADDLALAPNVVDYSEPVWLEFDYAANKGVQSDALWGQPNLAASEVLSALIQFPDWAKSWTGAAYAPYPILSGYRFYWNSDWSGVPYLRRLSAPFQVGLLVGHANHPVADSASPTVVSVC